MPGSSGMKSFHVLEVALEAELQGFEGAVCFEVQDVPHGQFVVRVFADSGSSFLVFRRAVFHAIVRRERIHHPRIRQADCRTLRAHESSEEHK